GQPALVIVAVGESIFALDGRTGKPAWRGLRDPGSPLQMPPLRLTESGELPRLASQAGDRTVARLVLPTNAEGQCLLLPSDPVLERPSALDPRLVRTIPLGPRSYQQAISACQEMLYLAALSLTGLVIPAWLVIGALRRRPRNWRIAWTFLFAFI